MPTVEAITAQLSSIQKQLNELIQLEKEKAPKSAMMTLYTANALINQALAQICVLSSK